MIFSMIIINSCITVANKDSAPKINSDFYFIRNPDARKIGYITTDLDSNINKKYELLYNENKSKLKLLTNFRNPISRPSITDLNLTKSGRIEMMVCVERTGNVTFVKILHENSSINDKNAFRKAVNYLGHFVWEKSTSDEEEECGKYTLNIDNKTR
ncbi:MAG: hypothetical protein IPH57_15040 [Saprospiraceae bacterium]|nr:hypothetical protein [Saprospiraceae bacterium]